MILEKVYFAKALTTKAEMSKEKLFFGFRLERAKKGIGRHSFVTPT